MSDTKPEFVTTKPVLVSTLSEGHTATNQTRLEHSGGTVSVTCPPAARTMHYELKGASASEHGWVVVTFFDADGAMIERVTITRPEPVDGVSGT